MLKYLSLALVLLLTFLYSGIDPSAGRNCRLMSPGALAAGKSDQKLLDEGKIYTLEDDLSFVFKFDRRPQLGILIIKVQIFQKDGKQDTSLTVTGNADMPSMRGAHSAGDAPFQLNKRGDYLLPVRIVMPGEWEVKISFSKQGNPIFFGTIRFNV